MPPLSEESLTARLRRALAALSDVDLQNERVRMTAYADALLTPDILALRHPLFDLFDIEARDWEMVRRAVMTKPDKQARAA